MLLNCTDCLTQVGLEFSPKDIIDVCSDVTYFRDNIVTNTRSIVD
jgi:hypothetical protein